jgi:hypothetical protein
VSGNQSQSLRDVEVAREAVAKSPPDGWMGTLRPANRPSPMARKGFRCRGWSGGADHPPDHPAEGGLLPAVVAGQGYARGVDVHLASRLRKLVASGCSIRSAARQLDVSRSAAMREMARPAPRIDLADELGDDPWDGDEETLERLDAMDAAEDEAAFVPPFTLDGLVECLDWRGRPAKDDKGRPVGRQMLQWRDANGREVNELGLYRFGLSLHEITPDGYETREEYLAAWDEADATIEAAKAHAWAQVKAAGIEYDDARRRYVQRPHAV